jgi:hypothetical protein
VHTSSIFYQIVLEPDTPLQFVPLVCGRITHNRPLTEGEVYASRVFGTANLKTLCYSNSKWKGFREHEGWRVAEPTYPSDIREIHAYILDLFDIGSEGDMIERIVKPLVSAELLALPTEVKAKKHQFAACGAGR